MQSGAECTMTSPTSENIRLTISITPEVHSTFQRLSKVSGKSISRSMGEWLGDTLDAAEFMASTLERARQAPKMVVQELQAYTLGLSDELSDVMQIIRKKGQEDRAAAGGEGPRLRGEGPAVAVEAPTPRPVIRGGKSKVKNHARGGKEL